MEEMQLTSGNVNDLFLLCLFSTREHAAEKKIVVEGVKTKVAFNKDILSTYQEEIWHLLEQLPVEFFSGYSFLHARTDKDGLQWTDLHTRVDQLLCLGIATGKAEILQPRETWNLLQGGVPHFIIKKTVDAN